MNSTIAADGDDGTRYDEFEAITIARSGSFALDLAPDDAFSLFSAYGEKLWVPGWEPFVLHGDGYEEGTVWVTEGPGRTTYWYVATFAKLRRHAKYVRVTPGECTGTVDVSVVSARPNASTVNVTYQLTGLSEGGNEHVATMLAPTAYAEMMSQWQAAIHGSRARIEAHLRN
ncbi:MAG: hypothetical protein AAFX85_20805 [Pseudomonadota bacterium]